VTLSRSGAHHTSSNHLRACVGSLYCSQCCLRSATSLGKTPSNSFRVVGMLTVARGRSERAMEMRCWLYAAIGVCGWYDFTGRVSGLESLWRLWRRANSAMAGRGGVVVIVYRTTCCPSRNIRCLPSNAGGQGLSGTARSGPVVDLWYCEDTRLDKLQMYMMMMMMMIEMS
jgi:hypothetical protein